MKKKNEKALAASLFAILGLAPGIAQAKLTDGPIENLTKQPPAAIFTAGDASFSYSQNDVWSAIKIVEGNGSQLSGLEYERGMLLIDTVERLRQGEYDVNVKAGEESSIELIERLLESQDPAFEPDGVKTAIIFDQIGPI